MKKLLGSFVTALACYSLLYKLVVWLVIHHDTDVPRFVARLLAPAASLTGNWYVCEKCRLPFVLVVSHNTPYKTWLEGIATRTTGVACLCEHDWRRLTPAQRLDYYMGSWPVNMTCHEDQQTRDAIQEAVLAGK